MVSPFEKSNSAVTEKEAAHCMRRRGANKARKLGIPAGCHHWRFGFDFTRNKKILFRVKTIQVESQYNTDSRKGARLSVETPVSERGCRWRDGGKAGPFILELQHS